MYDDGGLASGAPFPFALLSGRVPPREDNLDAIADTRTTVSQEVHEQFLEDIGALGRVYQAFGFQLELSVDSGAGRQGAVALRTSRMT